MDEDNVEFIQAVELSWLPDDGLGILAELLEGDEAKVSLKHVKQPREEMEEVGGKLTEDVTTAILSETLAKRRDISLPDGVRKCCGL